MTCCKIYTLSTKYELQSAWRKLIEEHLLDSQVVKYAVICTHNGDILMTTDNFNVTTDQLQTLIMHYTDVPTMNQR